MGDEFIPYEDCTETVFHLPETHLGYNAAGDLIKMKKFTVVGEIFERVIEDPDVSDRTVDKWVVYRKWQKVVK